MTHGAEEREYVWAVRIWHLGSSMPVGPTVILRYEPGEGELETLLYEHCVHEPLDFTHVEAHETMVRMECVCRDGSRRRIEARRFRVRERPHETVQFVIDDPVTVLYSEERMAEVRKFVENTLDPTADPPEESDDA